MSRKVSIVIPVFNESANIPVVVESIFKTIEKLQYSFEVIFVDDGSSDESLVTAYKLSVAHPNIYYIQLSRNFGHQNALKAGLDYATGDCVISMDGDMQHPPHLIPQLIEHWERGHDVVYTRRIDSDLTFFKRVTSKLFYKFLNAISDVDIEAGTADFRLLDRKVVDKLKSLKETDLFFRGLVKWVGFRQHSIEYTPAIRHSGESKYTFKKMRNLALRGITSFSIKPLIYSAYLGIFISVISVAVYIPYLANAVINRNYFPKWASLIFAISFFGGLNLMVLGMVGIYVGKLFMQAKERPNYIVKNTNLVNEPNTVHDIVEL